MYAQVEKPKENKSKAIANEVGQGKGSIRQGLSFAVNRSNAVTQRKMQSLLNDSHKTRQTTQFRIMADNGLIQKQQPIQMEERKTVIYGKEGQNWVKNMEIIDSNSPSDYVHLSRSTDTDPEQFGNQSSQHPDNFQITGNRGTTEEIATADDPHFDRALFNAANNVHITLEGRYMSVLRTLATQKLDNRIGIKSGPPVGNFANLNFGDCNVHGDQASNYSIQQWIEMAADDTEDFLRTNIDEEYEGQSGELIGVVSEVKGSTLNFANQLINTTPALKKMEDDNTLVHYGGAPWATTKI